jgi:outer membrane murein-binding lipoprotein Lpp
VTRLLVALAVVATFLPSGCARRSDVADLESQIERYRKDPSDALASRIDASFARLDADVAEIRADAAAKGGEAKAAALARADALEERGRALRTSYYAARVEAATDAAKDAVKQFGASVGKGIEDAGEKMKNALGGDAGQE